MQKDINVKNYKKEEEQTKEFDACFLNMFDALLYRSLSSYFS